MNPFTRSLVVYVPSKESFKHMAREGYNPRVAQAIHLTLDRISCNVIPWLRAGGYLWISQEMIAKNCKEDHKEEDKVN